MTTTADIFRPLALAARLLLACWPQLLLIGCLALMARTLLLNAAVSIGLQNATGGMIVLSLVVLVKLAALVLMFAVLRPHLPAVAALRRNVLETQGPESRPADHVLAVTAAAILPFFVYYAAWGFLGDTVREYSRLALAQAPFGESVDIFALVRSKGVFLSIALCWLVRFVAKRLNARAGHPYWRLLIVAADASWVFIGLYALDVWKDDWIRWLGAGTVLSVDTWWPSIAAHAAEAFVPAEFRPQPIGEQVQSLFFYALLPMIWLVMAAIINGYELSAPPRAAAPSSGSGLRKWLRDFADHFIGGYRSRYAPVWTCLKLTLGSGLATLLTFIVAYRLIAWVGAWLWWVATRTIGAHDLGTWELMADAISVFIGSPSDLDGGILLDPMRVVLLAAVLEYSVASAGNRRAGDQVTTARGR